jgi:ABC-type polysaccharide/polyol phosphate transport system ATPase subunit
VNKDVLSLLVQDGPKVLDDVSFHVKSGERVGIGARGPPWLNAGIVG